MKSDSQDSVRTLFSLPKEEKIYDDFGCSVVDTINHIGRLYLTENFICFNSSLIGFSKKIIIPFNDIIELKKSSKNTIQVNVKNQKKDKYQFTSFNETLIAYKRIKMMCRAYIDKITPTPGKNDENKNKINIILSDSEEEDEEDDDTFINSNNKNNESNIKKNNSTEILNNNNNIHGNIQKNKSESNLKDINDINEVEDINFPPLDTNQIENCKVVIDLSPKDFFKKYLTNASIDTCYKTYYESLGDHFNVVISDWRLNSDNNNNNINNNNNNNNNNINNNNLNNNNINNNNNNINNNNDNNNLFDCFADNNQKIRNLSFSIHLTGVPFINQSDVQKKQILSIENNGKLIIRGSSMSVGVPYCTYFSVEDQYEIYPYMKGTKTILRIISWRNFIKSSFLQSTIEKTCKVEYQKETDTWIDFIKKKGNSVEKYSPGKKKKKDDKKESKLTHGVEKVNSFTQQPQITFQNIFLMICDKIVNEIDFKTCFLLFFIFILYLKLSCKINSQKKEFKLLLNALKQFNINVTKNFDKKEDL